MKVAHVTTVALSLRYLLLDQLRSLQAEGYSVTGISAPGPDVSAIETAGIRHIGVPMTRSFSPLADLRSFGQLYRVMKRERFMIVHTHTPKAGFLGQLAARIAGVPIIINTVHGFYFHAHMNPIICRFYLTLEKIAALCSDVILSQSLEDKAIAVRKKICPPEKIEYLGNGINLEAFNPDKFSDKIIQRKRIQLAIPAEAKIVGFVGRLAAKRKGFLDFLSAARQVSRSVPNVCFLIIGDPDFGKPDAVSPSNAKNYGIWHQCRFLGMQPYSELPSFYALMNVKVLPSLFEGISRTLMEASAMRVPIVATDVKGNREAVENGRNGFLVPLGDVQALTHAIVELLSKPEQAFRMGEEGRKMAIERFDERLVFEKVKSTYTRLLAEKGIPKPEPRRSPLK